METIGEYIEEYGEPIFRFKTTHNYSDDDRLIGDVPEEIAVFKIPVITKIMVVGKTRNIWISNYGERIAIAELLKRQKLL